MRWGTPSRHQIFEARAEPWKCDFTVLGDPAPGDPSKVCECEVEETPSLATSRTEWVYCASQFMLCDCPGRIRWGIKTKWTTFPKGPALSCTTNKLGDPAPGDAGKHCQCEVEIDSAFYAKISPAVKQLDETPKVVSCDILLAAKDGELWDQKLWKAVEGICTKMPNIPKHGKGTLQQEPLRLMVDAWISKGFEENYANLYENGWLEEAFVNFIGPAPSGTKWAKINEQLIRSVHLFSSRPVVVVHFGMATPSEWDPSQYPRLVVLHAAPFPPEFFRRFDLNKYRSFLVARVKTGIQLDSDQFVAPGVDELFQLAKREGSETYPLPILPVHFMRNEELPMFPSVKGGFTMSGGVSHVFDRYCKHGICNVSTRWGHAHPTWTFWALPFLGTWIRRHLRDETLPASAKVPALRVTDIDVDEDLLNIGTWEERGHKQWCKFDVMDPAEFQKLLSAKIDRDSEPRCRVRGPPPIVADPVFHPEGAALVFYTAHHAVQPEVSAGIIDELQKKQKKKELPGPIFYRGCFYKDGNSFKKAHPGVRCLI